MGEGINGFKIIIIKTTTNKTTEEMVEFFVQRYYPEDDQNRSLEGQDYSTPTNSSNPRAK